MLHHEAFSLVAYLYGIAGGALALLTMLWQDHVRVRPGMRPGWRVWLATKLYRLAYDVLLEHRWTQWLAWPTFNLAARIEAKIVHTFAWRRKVYVGTLEQLYRQLKQESPDANDWLWLLPSLKK